MCSVCVLEFLFVLSVCGCAKRFDILQANVGQAQDHQIKKKTLLLFGSFIPW